MLPDKIKIETDQGIIFAEVLEGDRVKLTGEPLRVEYSIESFNHIKEAVELYRHCKPSALNKIYDTLYLLLIAPAGHA